MDEYSIDEILEELKEQEWSCDNLSLRIVRARLDHDKKPKWKRGLIWKRR